VCRPKHVEQLRNTGIINSATRLHLVGSFYEFYKFRYCGLITPLDMKTSKCWGTLYLAERTDFFQ